MSEHQNIEWKEVWRDDFLKWICGFANADGGVLHIGRNDEGAVVGLPNAAKLMHDIPNKVRDILGILVAVNLREEAGKEYLQIVVEPYPYPVSYKGEYHLRSGGTKQELKGAALDKFLLRKQGKHWDGVPVPHVSVKRSVATDHQPFPQTGQTKPAPGFRHSAGIHACAHRGAALAGRFLPEAGRRAAVPSRSRAFRHVRLSEKSVSSAPIRSCSTRTRSMGDLFTQGGENDVICCSRNTSRRESATRVSSDWRRFRCPRPPSAKRCSMPSSIRITPRHPHPDQCVS